VAVAAEVDWPRRSLLLPVEDGVAPVEVGCTISAAAPTRTDWPSNVTRAFSVTQDRLAELKRARMRLPKRGMEKLDWAAEMSRGMELPSVTLAYAGSVARFVVVQPEAPLTEHVEPVKPLVHIHEQVPVEREDVPPF